MSTAKERYWAKKKAAAPMIACACGCERQIKAVDDYGRPRTMVSGHNRRRYTDGSNWAIQRRYRKAHPEKIRNDKRARYRMLKLRAMKLLGNKCSKCPIRYTGKNAPIFEFHHPDPSKKEAGITRWLLNRAWGAVVDELKKCVLVCANCHNQYHGGEW